MYLKLQEVKTKADIILSDVPKRGAQGSKITYKGKYEGNVDKEIVNYESETGFYLKDGKNLINSVIFKNNPTSGKQFKLEYKVSTSTSSYRKYLTVNGYKLLHTF